MRTLYLITLLSLMGNCMGAIAYSPFAEKLLKDGQAHETLQALCKATDTKLPDTSLDAVIEVTQAMWRRKPGQERWEMGDPYIGYTDIAMPYIKKLGLLDPINPQHQSYDYALILGAITTTMAERLAYLDELVKDGLKFGSIILLTGQRDLTQKEVEAMSHYGPITTEAAALDALAHDAKLYPHLQTVKKLLVDTPKKVRADGVLWRPTTGDTVAHWLDGKPKKGTCLAISSQPFAAYQDTALRTFLTEDFSLETVGKIDGRERTTSLYLDNIAGWLYQERLREQALK